MTFMFENLDVYRKAVDFVDNIYSLCDNLKQGGLFKIVDQLRRASLSIMGRGSLHECIPLLEILFRRKLLSQEEFIKLYNNADQIGMMLNGLIRSVDNYSSRKADSRKAENPLAV